MKGTYDNVGIQNDPLEKVVREKISFHDSMNDNIDFQVESPHTVIPEVSMDQEVDFAWQGDLENYARGLTIPGEAIERWISAGLLLPDELKVAEKILKILRENKEVHQMH
ncbi:MAG: hypothetical protein HKM93_00990 [Desulfobacteraceae bacterium]|nr:hypothetical protein [Desulfobacteraceae bacterium]